MKIKLIHNTTGEGLKKPFLSVHNKLLLVNLDCKKAVKAMKQKETISDKTIAKVI